MNKSPLKSALYRGSIRHRRFAPHAHAFEYRMFMLYLDLAELDRVFVGRWLWSVNRRNVAEFRRSDYLGDPQIALDDAVRNRYFEVTGQRPTGPIRLLAHLRYFGYCFNPVSFYYCFADDGETLLGIVAEITNTPWRERHSYVLPVAASTRHGRAYNWEFGKAFHVSPFLPMDLHYDWRFQSPEQTLRVHMNVGSEAGERRFDSTLVLQREPLDGAALARALAAHPWMTAKVLLGIHWQALLLWLRRNPVYDHPVYDPLAKNPPVSDNSFGGRPVQVTPSRGL